jgi:hypothetical protein
LSDPSQHIASSEQAEHICVKGSTENGACLFHNESDHKPVSCSYRWQGKNDPRGGKYSEVYANYPLASAKAQLAERGIGLGYLKTMQRVANSGNITPAEIHYRKWLKLPQNKGDWDLHGPLGVARDATRKFIPPGQNFTGMYWPYWNNAHHLIPKAMFRDRIFAIKDRDVRNLVIIGLFRAKYNINHYVNVMFLPMDAEVGRLLRLPRHLSLKGVSQIVDRKPCFDHVQYTRFVYDKLKPVIEQDFTKAAKEAMTGKTKCEALKVVTMAKHKLERISRKCFDEIVSFGERSPGAPLVDIGE